MAVHYINKENITVNVLSSIVRDQKGMKTGFRDFDEITGGLMNGQLYVIGGRPGMGKTAFMLNLSENLTVRGGKKAVIYSLEHSAEQLLEKMIRIDAGISSEESCDPDGMAIPVLCAAANRISDSGLVIDDTILVDFADKLENRMSNELNDADVILIDYLQLITPGQYKKLQSRREETEYNIRILKNMARTLNIPVIVLSQCSRMCEQRIDHRPMLSDLRDTGVIEECADVVAFIFREEYYRQKDIGGEETAEFIIAKNRFGRTGTASLMFSPDRFFYCE